MRRPRLTEARVALTREVEVTEADGTRRALRIPVERPLALYVDRREFVTLMTLGQAPELLTLGYLLNQRLVESIDEIESVTVDWEVGASAARTRGGIAGFEERVARRTVTTGCGQGTVFGAVLDAASRLPALAGVGAPLEAETLAHLLETMRALPSVHREAGSVHGTALWRGDRMLVHIEDVGRHNAVDTIAGWMAMNGLAGGAMHLYTTGRLTSEMVLKAALVGVPFVVSRNGVSAMGVDLAERLGITLVGRASGRRWICYTAPWRLLPAAG